MTDQARILIVDDEESIRYFLSEELAQAGYAVFTAASGEEALRVLGQGSIDLVLLDLKMGGISGLQVMEKIKQGYPPASVPPVVIMLTAHASLDSAVSAMRRGGFDYLKKPCRPEELLASVEKGLAQRRESLQRQKMIRLIEETARQLESPSLPAAEPPLTRPQFLEGGGLLLDRQRETVTRAGHPLPLTPSEFRLLACLMEQTNQPVSYRKLAAAIHERDDLQWEEWEARQAISTHVWRLQRKLGRAPGGKPHIVNVRGKGYKFSAP